MPHATIRPGERTENVLREFFGTFRACSGPLALFRSDVPCERRLLFGRPLLKIKGESGRSGEI
jgi:hypothetical protein